LGFAISLGIPQVGSYSNKTKKQKTIYKKTTTNNKTKTRNKLTKKTVTNNRRTETGHCKKMGKGACNLPKSLAGFKAVMQFF
jgi:hypothetical protein